MRAVIGALATLVIAIGGLVWNAIQLSYNAGQLAEQVVQLKEDDLASQSQLVSMRQAWQNSDLTVTAQLASIQQTLADLKAAQTQQIIDQHTHQRQSGPRH